MKKYASLFRIRFTTGLQYRTAAWAGVLTQFIWGIMNILLYQALYRANSGAFPISLSATSTYIWLQQGLLSLFMLWMWDKEIFEDIIHGNIAYTLARPMDLYNFWFTKNMALRLAGAALRCMPILVIALFLPAPYRLSLPASWGAFGLFVLSMLLAFLNVVAFSMLVYISTFHTMDPMGVRMIALSMTDFLTGALIPLPFLPEGLRKVIELTPFGAMQNLPFLVYSGSVTGAALIRGILVQVFWLGTLLLLGKVWMARTLKRVVVQGG